MITTGIFGRVALSDGLSGTSLVIMAEEFWHF